MKSAQPSVPTGFKKLDRNRLSYKAGALSVVVARAGHGKTTFLLNTLLRMAAANPSKAFHYFTYEEPAANLLTKLALILGGEDLGNADLKNMEEHAFRITQIARGQGSSLAGLDKLAALKNVHVHESLGYDAATLSAGIQQLKRERDTKPDLDGTLRPLGAVFVDYLQRVPAPAGPSTNKARSYEMADVSNHILEAAIKTGVPVIAAAQHSRKADEKEKGTLSSIADASAIEKDADLVLSLWNPVQAAAAEGKDTKGINSDIEITVLKNRTGAISAKSFLPFIGSLLTIED